MSWASERNATLAFALTFALLILNGILSYRNTLAVADRERRVAHTREVLDVLQSILATLADAETGQRGYLITGEVRYLQPYIGSRAKAETDIEHLRALAADSLAIPQMIPSLKQQVLATFYTMKETIAVRNADGFEAAQRLVRTERGKNQMDAIRQLIAEMKDAENARLARRAELSRATTQTALGVLATTTALGAAFVGLCFYLVNQNFRRRKAVESELRLVNECFKLADQRKNEFLAILAHELRNPLASLFTGLHLQRQCTADPSAIQQASNLMQRQVKYMSCFIDDLLDVSRIGQGKLQLRKEPFDLSTAVASSVDTVRPLIEERRQELTVSLPNEPVGVEADPARIAQVVTNLLTNAAKYTNEAGQLWLTVQRQGSEAILSVRDTGVGIPAEMLPKVFDLFVQVDSTLDHSYGGLGIGLNLVRRLVEMHGGSLEARSDGVDKGSEFIVRIPHCLKKVSGSLAEMAVVAQHRFK